MTAGGAAMDLPVFFVVLAAATLHASWNALVKVGEDRLAVIVLLTLTASAVALPVALWTGPPAPASWPYLGLSVLHMVYFAMLVPMYRLGDLSQVYPLARGSAPLIVVALAAAVGGETLGPLGVMAVIVISLGILTLALGGPGLAGGGWRPVLVALATALTIGVYTIADGLGGRAADGVASYIAWLFLLMGPPLLVLALARRGAGLIDGLRRAWRPGVLGGVMAMASYAAVIWAMSVAPIAYVSALRETSVVIAALIGARLLREPFAGARLAAVAIVVAGAVLLQIVGDA